MTLLRFSFILTCLGFIAGCQSRSAKPNIILIFADDLGYETLGAYGGEDYHTPELDRLAREGILFQNCYSTPLCTPSRVQIMTGKYNFRNYIGFGLLDPAEKTFAHYLKQNGYVTGVAGKWQLLGNDQQRKLAGGRIGSWPEEAGFDEYLLWQVDERGSRYKDPTLTATGRKTLTFEGEYGPDKFLQFIETFVESHRDTSFFLYYPMTLTHEPFVPTPDLPGFMDSIEQRKNQVRYFKPMVHYMDSLVGRINYKLESLGIRENTLLLFIGDNGTDRDITSTVNGVQIRGNKGYTTDAGTHVPFIASWPSSIHRADSSSDLIDFTDILPTLLDAAGIEQGGMDLDGRSFLGRITGSAYTPREWIFTHYDPAWGNFKAARYVQNKDWKLYGDGRVFLISRDPEELDTLTIADLERADASTLDKFREVLETMK